MAASHPAPGGSVVVGPVAAATGPEAGPRRPAVLVMTATIRPPENCPALARSDPALRLDDYRTALLFYLTLPTRLVDRILFIDNSDYDLTPLVEAARAQAGDKRVEFVSFQGNDHPPYFGKGYGEFRLLDHGLARSSLVRPGDVLWKVTGRLQVANLAELIDSAPPAYGVYCDLRSVPLIGDRLGGNHWMDLRVFSVTADAYGRILRGRFPYMRVREGVAPEQYLYKVMRKFRDRERVVPRFRLQPRVVGYNGHSNRDYQGTEYLRKERLRRLARRCLPWLWL
jgi:hypothetical protein